MPLGSRLPVACPSVRHSSSTLLPLATCLPTSPPFSAPPANFARPLLPTYARDNQCTLQNYIFFSLQRPHQDHTLTPLLLPTCALCAAYRGQPNSCNPSPPAPPPQPDYTCTYISKYIQNSRVTPIPTRALSEIAKLSLNATATNPTVGADVHDKHRCCICSRLPRLIRNSVFFAFPVLPLYCGAYCGTRNSKPPQQTLLSSPEPLSTVGLHLDYPRICPLCSLP